MLVGCYWCGKRFKRSPGHIKKNTRQFCSREHYHKWQNTEEGKRVLSDNGRLGGEMKTKCWRDSDRSHDMEGMM